MLRIGIDTGGTFTDFAWIRAGIVGAHKVPSDPGNPAAPILRGLAELGLPRARREAIHGTTVATNALLQRRGSRTGILTTAGFEDILEIGRQARPSLYGLCGRRPAPLVPRRFRVGLRERVLPDGTVEVSLSPAEVRRALRFLAGKGIESLAVCFLHSYRNPVHENSVARIADGGLSLCLSHRVSPEYREYERFSTTVANAYLSPILGPHLRGLRRALGRVTLRVMTSNGGSTSAARAAEEAVRTILSGPAGGVLGAARLGRLLNLPNLIALDMGGTSTDVSLLEGGVRYTTEAQVGGCPLRLPMIDIETVGAGGGSIARRDRGGALRVGPESGGADPGPVCYGKGEEPTVTDANLFLGRLSAGDFLGGGMTVQPERTASVLGRFARKFSRSPEEVAEGILRIANATMERAIRKVSVARGYDPRRFLLLCYGGAAGLHACDLARSLRIPGVLVPIQPGAFSAIGMLLSDAAKDYARTLLQDLSSLSPERLEGSFRSLERQGEADLRREGFPGERIRFLRSLDLRYPGQSYELNLPWRPLVARGIPGKRAGGSPRVDPERIRAAFHRLHLRRYGYSRKDRPVELVNVRVQAVGISRAGTFPRLRGGRSRGRRGIGPAGSRVVFYGGKRIRVPVFPRVRLRPGNRFPGPALVTEYSSTLFVAPDFRCSVDPYGNLYLFR